jgi:hypothetical protein
MEEPASGSRATLGRSAGPEWLRGIAEPEESGAQDTTSMDWLRGIAEAPADEAEAVAEPAAAEAPAASSTDSGEWINLVNPAGQAADSATTGEWLRMLKEEGVPSPEAEPGRPIAAAAAVAAASPAGDMDDAQVFDWLEALAAKQGIPAPEEVVEPSGFRAPMTPPPPVAAPAQKVIPEEPDAGMKWLEELAAEQSPEPTRNHANDSCGLPFARCGHPPPPPPTVPAQPPRLRPNSRHDDSGRPAPALRSRPESPTG